MAPYAVKYPVGSRVKVLARDQLDAFQRSWKYHHPLGAEQLPFAGPQATVTWVASYHGGDMLYQREGISGIWHECCLAAVE